MMASFDYVKLPESFYTGNTNGTLVVVVKWRQRADLLLEWSRSGVGDLA